MLKLSGAWLCGLYSVPQGSGLSRLRSSLVVSCWRCCVVVDMWCTVDALTSGLFVAWSNTWLVVSSWRCCVVVDMWCAVDALTSGLFCAVFSEVEVPEAECPGDTQYSNPVIWCRNLEISSESHMDWWLDDCLNSPIRNYWNEKRSWDMVDVGVMITQQD